MGENFGSKVTYFVVGLGLGELVRYPVASKSGEETREFLVEKADEGSKYAQRKARELKERAEDLIEKSKEVAARQKESITAAVAGFSGRQGMGWKGGSKVAYFVLGLGLRALGGNLFAPKSGEENPAILAEKGDEGKKYP